VNTDHTLTISTAPAVRERLLVQRPEAAAILSISMRCLDSLAANGSLRPTRIGRSVRYSLESLKAFARKSNHATTAN
jgi:excisionase family DNA binding protein